MNYLLVDGLNMFMRAKHVGGRGQSIDMKIGMAMHIMFNSINKCWREFDGTEADAEKMGLPFGSLPTRVSFYCLQCDSKKDHSNFHQKFNFDRKAGSRGLQLLVRLFQAFALYCQ